MFDIILAVFLAFRNSARAKLKGQKPLVWGLITAGAFLVTYIIGEFIVIFVFCKDQINFDLMTAADSKSSLDAAVKQVQQALLSNPLHMVTMELFGVGGYLLVRYLIDLKPDKKKPEMHWMDKMGEQKSEN